MPAQPHLGRRKTCDLLPSTDAVIVSITNVGVDKMVQQSSKYFRTFYCVYQPNLNGRTAQLLSKAVEKLRWQIIYSRTS